MIRQPTTTRKAVLLAIVSVVALLAIYTLLARRQHQANPEDTTIPTWSQLGEGVTKAVEKNPRSGDRWILTDARATVTRLFLGLFVGICGAILLGLLMGCFPTIEAFFVPPLSLLAKVPPTAALPVFFAFAGTNTTMFIAMIVFGILPALAQTVHLAVREVPEELLYKAYTLGASETELIWNVIVRAILPRLIDAVRLLIGPAMVYLIAAEVLCGGEGFGYRIRLQSHLLNMSVVYPYLAVLAAFGFALDYGLRRLQRVCCPWYVPREQ